MEEIEVPTEHLHETLHEKAHEGGGHGGGAPWAARAALTSAIIAVLAAISALLAGHHANEAMIDQMRATDEWAYYQAKGIKASVLHTKMETLAALGKTVDPKDEARVTQYEHEQETIQEGAKEKETASQHHLLVHNDLAKSVTFYQVAIAMAAIAVLGRRRWLWFFSMALGLVATAQFFLALH